MWADAAADAWLDHEVVEALRELVKVVPWRADVWLRLGEAGLRIGWPDARDALERALSSTDDRDSVRLALLKLCDLDMAMGDPDRAQRWLDRIPPPFSGTDSDVALRRLECAMEKGDRGLAEAAAAALGALDVVDGRTALARSRLALWIDPASVLGRQLAIRALLLEAPGAEALVASIVASSRDAVEVDRFRKLVRGLGLDERPQWEAAFALAEGRRDDARRALAKGLGAGDLAAAAALLRLAVESRDASALEVVYRRDERLLSAELSSIRAAAEAVEGGDARRALDLLDEVSGDASAWAHELRCRAVASLAQRQPVGWAELFEELRQAARALDDLDALSAVEALAVERDRPLRLAVVGEFNAGKSTFLNALLGVDVAPTGVLPTTATLHWVAWAQDPFARIVVLGAEDRVVPHADLKRALSELAEASATVVQVFIYAPIERLKRVEVLDTPGFNAPDPKHLHAARRAFDEAHVVAWLIDASHPMKETERAVLAELTQLGVPVQILVNKADRLGEAELARVMKHVVEGLEESSLCSLAPPVAFSAKLSLAGRLGDEGALARSGWDGVEDVLSRRIVDASDALREGALFRKARRVAHGLVVSAGALAERDRKRTDDWHRESEKLRIAAARFAAERAELAKQMDRAIEPSRRALTSDLRPVAEISADRLASDPGVRGYTEKRVMERLGDAVFEQIGQAAQIALPERARLDVRAVFGGAAASLDSPAELAHRPLGPLIEVALDVVATALGLEAMAAPPPSPAARLHARLVAVEASLPAPQPPQEG